MMGCDTQLIVLTCNLLVNISIRVQVASKNEVAEKCMGFDNTW